ncbi:MAG: hypothetical protein ABIR78_10140 [Ferruginibacter sp.]
MKKIIFTIAAAFILHIGFSQSISKITITGNGQVDVIAFGLDENVQIYVTKDGNISKWGYDKYIGYQENYNGVLDPYVGRIEYYTQNDDESLRGKVKYIGKTLLTYYASYEQEGLKGKLKAVGLISIDYYLPYEDAAYRGTIKMLGQQAVTWYASYENKDLRGKLKGIGSTAFAYYGSFEDKAFRGKIKSIDRYTITYFSSFEQYSGSVKSGATILNANGIKYYIRNY